MMVLDGIWALWHLHTSTHKLIRSTQNLLRINMNKYAKSDVRWKYHYAMKLGAGNIRMFFCWSVMLDCHPASVYRYVHRLCLWYRKTRVGLLARWYLRVGVGSECIRIPTHVSLTSQREYVCRKVSGSQVPGYFFVCPLVFGVGIRMYASMFVWINYTYESTGNPGRNFDSYDDWYARLITIILLRPVCGSGS